MRQSMDTNIKTIGDEKSAEAGAITAQGATA